MEILHNFGEIGKQILDWKIYCWIHYEMPNEAKNYIAEILKKKLNPRIDGICFKYTWQFFGLLIFRKNWKKYGVFQKKRKIFEKTKNTFLINEDDEKLMSTF